MLNMYLQNDSFDLMNLICQIVFHVKVIFVYFVVLFKYKTDVRSVGHDDFK